MKMIRVYETWDDLQALSLELTILAFLSGRNQLDEKVNQTHLFVYIWNVQYEEKIFRLTKNEIPLTFYGLINQLWTATHSLRIFLPPLLQKGYSKNE